MCDMTQSEERHGSFWCTSRNQCAVSRISTKRDMTHAYVRHSAFISMTCLIHTCDVTHLYVWHDSFTCVTCLIHVCDMTHSCVWLDYESHHRDSNTGDHPYTMNESCHTYERVMSHTWISHATHLNHTYEWVMSQTWMSHVTYMNESCHKYEHMGWLWSVGSIKL